MKKMQLPSLQGSTDTITAMELTHDQQRLICVSEDGMIMVWNIVTGEPGMSEKRDCSFSSCAVSPDGSTLIAGDTDGIAHIISLGDMGVI